MITKKSTAKDDTPESAFLKIPVSEAMALIQDRIDKGEVLFSRAINNQPEMDAARDEEKRWTDYNAELLARIFTTEQIKKEYLRNGFRIVALSYIHETPVSQHVLNFRKDVRAKIEALRSVSEKLPLLAPQSPTAIDHRAATPSVSTKKVFIVHCHMMA